MTACTLFIAYEVEVGCSRLAFVCSQGSEYVQYKLLDDGLISIC